MEISPILAGYLLLVNGITLALFGMDKISAISGAERTRERTLFLLALFGGSIGAVVGSFIFRHKRNKASFMAVIALIFLLQLAILLYFFKENLHLSDNFTYIEP